VTPTECLKVINSHIQRYK